MTCRNTAIIVDEKGRNVAHRRNPFRFETVREEWDALLNNFCLRRSTKESARLPAFSIIPKQFTYAFGPEEGYVAAHWRCHLPADPLWQNEDFVKDRRDTFPMWSWASCEYATDKPKRPYLDIPFFNERYVTAKMSVGDVDVGLVNLSNPFCDVHYAKLLVSATLVPVNMMFKGQGDGGRAEYLMDIEGAEYIVDNARWLKDCSGGTHFKGQLDGYFRRLNEERLMKRLTMSQGRHYLAEILRGESDKENPKSRGLIPRRSARRDAEKRRPYKRVGTYEMSFQKDDADVGYYGDGFTGSASDGEGTGEGDDRDAMANRSDTSRVNLELHQSRRVCYPFDAMEIKRFWLI